MEFTTGLAQVFFSTARLEATTPDGVSVGTGFFFNYQTEELRREGRTYFFLVSNKHVVEGSTEMQLFFTEGGEDGKPVIGSQVSVTLHFDRGHWHGHPNPDVDVAVVNMANALNELRERQGKRVFIRGFSLEEVPSEDEALAVGVLEQVVFAGYPIGLYDEVNLLPIARQGVLASPYALDYRGEPTFLIDASIFPGSSGSPVLWQQRAVNESGEQGVRVRLLGIVSSVFFMPSVGDVEIAPIPSLQRTSVKIDQMIDVGIVFKARTVVETIEDLLRLRGLI